MIGRILLFAIAPLLAHAQLVFSIVDGSQETAFTQQSLVYQLRTVEPGMTSSILLRVRNTGSSNADVTQFSAVGAGFTLNRPLPPQTLAPGQILNGTLTFTSGSPANYNAAVRMNAVTLTVLVTVVGAAVLETDPPCSRSSTGTIAFGTVHVGQPVLCNARLHNGTDQPIVITALHVDGPGFSMQAPATPIDIACGRCHRNRSATGRAGGRILRRCFERQCAAVCVDGHRRGSPGTCANLGLGNRSGGQRPTTQADDGVIAAIACNDDWLSGCKFSIERLWSERRSRRDVLRERRAPRAFCGGEG
ncbi:MAG: hypothetical protein WDO18_04290 [Acidobacteriota bacterium]